MSFLEKGESQAVGLETLRGHCVSVLFVASQSSVYHTLGEENVLGMQGWAFVVVQDLDSARFVLQLFKRHSHLLRVVSIYNGVYTVSELFLNR